MPGFAVHTGTGVEQDKVAVVRADRGNTGATTPAVVRSLIEAAATMPPVLPGEIIASASPRLTKSIATASEQFFLRRKPSTGLSSMVRISGA